MQSTRSLRVSSWAALFAALFAAFAATPALSNPACDALADVYTSIAKAEAFEDLKIDTRRDLKLIQQHPKQCIDAVASMQEMRAFGWSTRNPWENFNPIELTFLRKHLPDEVKVPARVDAPEGWEGQVSIEIDVEKVAALRKRLPR